MRDKLIHQYFGVDLKIVWDTIKNDLPILEKQITEILEEIQKLEMYFDKTSSKKKEQ